MKSQRDEGRMRPEYYPCCGSYFYRVARTSCERGEISSLTMRQSGRDRVWYRCQVCRTERVFRDRRSMLTWLRRSQGPGPNVHDPRRAP